VGLLGKNPTVSLANEETARDTVAIGEPKMTGLQGEMEVQAGRIHAMRMLLRLKWSLCWRTLSRRIRGKGRFL
jgi:hypothetical protein